MLQNIQILTDATSANADGVFIPTSDIAGLSGAEISQTGATLEGKLAYGFLNGLFSALGVVNPLGFAEFDKTSPAGTGDNTYTEGVEITLQRLVDLRTGLVALPTLPDKGTHLGQGKLLLTDVWENCALIGDGDMSAGAGVIIPDSWIESYGGAIPANVANDAREWFAALLWGMANTLTVRTATVNSAITFRTILATNRVTGAAIPTEWYDDTNPKADLAAADLPFVRVIQERVRIEYEILTNPLAQTFEINVRTV